MGYAEKWKEITAERYFEIYNNLGEQASVYSGYTNPDGDDGLSSTPQILTTWGDDKNELIKCVRRKEDREDKEWKERFWEAVEWEAEKEAAEQYLKTGEV
jgi:hypothetical protein